MVKINPLELHPNTVNQTEFGYLDGVLQNIQDRLDTFLFADGSQELTANWTVTQDISATKFSAVNCVFNGTSDGAKVRAENLFIGNHKLSEESDSNNFLVLQFSPVNGIGGLKVKPTYSTGANGVFHFMTKETNPLQIHFFGVRQKTGTTDLGHSYWNQWLGASGAVGGWYFYYGDRSVKIDYPSNQPAFTITMPAGHTGRFFEVQRGGSVVMYVDVDGNMVITGRGAAGTNGIVQCGGGKVFKVGNVSGVSGTFVDSLNTYTVTAGIITDIQPIP